MSLVSMLPACHLAWLETGTYGSSGAVDWFFAHHGGVDEAWRTVGATVLEEWIAKYPGTRPWAWWRYDAPEPRRRIGGTGDVFHPGCFLMGIETNFVTRELADCYNGRNIRPADRSVWNREWVEGYFTKAPVDPADHPMFESQAAYLSRLGLLLPEERPGLIATAFEPEGIPVVGWRTHEARWSRGV